VLLDVLVVAWAAAWLVLGVQVGREVDGLKELSSTVRATGGAVEAAGQAVRSLESVPLVGERVAEPARRLEEAGRSAEQSGRSSRESIEALSLLLGFAVAVVPSVPVLGFYLLLRRGRHLQSRSPSPSAG